MLCRHFDDSLKQLLLLCGYQTSLFKGHSFRIGAANDAALSGMGTNWFDLQRTSTEGRSAPYIHLPTSHSMTFHDLDKNSMTFQAWNPNYQIP